MRKARHHHYSKVSYRPIEAAIRWSDLMRFESRILHVIGDKPIPDLQDFPRWPMLCLNTERIFDAIRNGDLSFGKNGITSNDPMLFDDPDLTVRHVDLKLWMSHFYPDQKPPFLFDVVERQLQPASAHCLPTTKAGPESASALYGQNSLRQGGIWTPAIADCNCSRTAAWQLVKGQTRDAVVSQSLCLRGSTLGPL